MIFDLTDSETSDLMNILRERHIRPTLLDTLEAQIAAAEAAPVKKTRAKAVAEDPAPVE